MNYVVWFPSTLDSTTSYHLWSNAVSRDLSEDWTFVTPDDFHLLSIPTLGLRTNLWISALEKGWTFQTTHGKETETVFYPLNEIPRQKWRLLHVLGNKTLSYSFPFKPMTYQSLGGKGGVTRGSLFGIYYYRQTRGKLSVRVGIDDDQSKWESICV